MNSLVINFISAKIVVEAINMKLYHGSSVPDIKELTPKAYNGGEALVYMTYSEVLAAIYAHNPLTRPNGCFTYWFGKDGRLYYDEYFENQTQVLYSGQKGYVYECAGDYMQMEKMPWVYLSKEPVKVVNCVEIPDIYKLLLKYESEGKLTIRRWNEVPDGQKEIWEKVVKRSLDKKDLTTPLGQEYYRFIKAHFENIE